MGRLLYPKQVKEWIRGAANSSMPEVLSRPKEMIIQYFLPSAASVVTISAPTILFSASLNSFLIGLGVYLGFIWQRNLDSNAGINDSRDVFITYIIGVGASYAVYSLPALVQVGQGYKDPRVTVLETMEQIMRHALGQHELSEMDDNIVTSTSPGSSNARQAISDQQILIRALRDSARLRKELAKAEELTAEYYEHLLQSGSPNTDSRL